MTPCQKSAILTILTQRQNIFAGQEGAGQSRRAPLYQLESFICTIDNTYVAEEHLNEKGKVDYETLKPVLFEFPTYKYLKTGEVIGKCLSFKSTPEK